MLFVGKPPRGCGKVSRFPQQLSLRAPGSIAADTAEAPARKSGVGTESNDRRLRLRLLVSRVTKPLGLTEPRPQGSGLFLAVHDAHCASATRLDAQGVNSRNSAVIAKQSPARRVPHIGATHCAIHRKRSYSLPGHPRVWAGRWSANSRDARRPSDSSRAARSAW